VQVGDVVHAFSFGGPTVFHARSTDGGRTWPLREQSLGTFFTNTQQATEQRVQVVAQPDKLLVASHDMTLGPRVVRSFDGGTTWFVSPPLATTVVPQSDTLRTRVHSNGDELVVVWTNVRPNGRVFCNRSTDFGATWQGTDTLLEVGFVAPAPDVQYLLVHGGGPLVHVVWWDGTVRRQRSTDGGITWLPAVGGLTGAAAFATQVPLRLVGDGTTLLLRVGTELVRSTGAGTTWSHVTSHGIPFVLDVAMQGNLAVVAGRGPLPNTVYMVNVSTDGGATWQPIPLQSGAPNTNVTACASVDSGAVFVQWEVPGYPGSVFHSADAGASWQLIDGPVQAGFEPGPVRALHTASITSSLPIRYFAYAGIGSTLLGVGTPGTGGVSPRLSTNGLPVRGRTSMVQGDSLLGGAPCGLGISFQSPTALPFAGGMAHLASLDVLLPYVASGGAGQAGAGSFTQPLAIPNVASLVGAELVLQGIAIDASANAGLSLTNALELWLR
jgi:hypothetical protein